MANGQIVYSGLIPKNYKKQKIDTWFWKTADVNV